MSSENEEGRDRLTTWVVGGSVALGVALVAIAAVLSWPTRALANALQLLGIGLTALGVAVVRSWLHHAIDDSKRGLQRVWTLLWGRLRLCWAGLWGQPDPLEIRTAVSVGEGGGDAEDRANRAVNPEMVSDREWLAFLNEQVDVLRERLDAVDKLHSEHLDERLAAQRNELRAETHRETRQGWQLIAAGLLWAFIGTGAGFFG